MNNILTNEDIRSISDELSILGNCARIDFSDLDFNAIQDALTSGPAARYLQPPNPEFTKLLPLLSEEGEYAYKYENHIIRVPSVYVPMVNFAFYRFSSIGAVSLATWSVVEVIWEYIERFLRWVLRLKKTVQDQLEQILKEADRHYQYFRDKVQELKKDHDDDMLFEMLLLIPDLFVYLCRLLADSSVSKELKVEYALALIYLVSPFDLIPEAFIQHPIAFMDDFAIIAYVIKRSFDTKYVDRSTLEQHWPGDVALLDRIGEWYQAARRVLGGNLVDMIADYLRRKGPQASAV